MIYVLASRTEEHFPQESLGVEALGRKVAPRLSEGRGKNESPWNIVLAIRRHNFFWATTLGTVLLSIAYPRYRLNGATGTILNIMALVAILILLVVVISSWAFAPEQVKGGLTILTLGTTVLLIWQAGVVISSIRGKKQL